MSFKSLGIAPSLLKVLELNCFFRPYSIQKEAMPVILDGKDILGIAKTGSGKTASYVLPILTNLQETPDPKNRYVDVLVLVPTRELAIQVNDVFQIFCNHLPKPIKTLAVFGGASINPQMIKMQGVSVLIATSGRLLELVESKAVHLSEVKTLVIDEADKLLHPSFKDEMDRIFALLPKKRQTLLYSATLSDDLSSIPNDILHEPEVIKIYPRFEEEEEDENIDQITQLAYFIDEEKKGPLLRYLIKTKKMKQVLIFTSSIKRADNVANKLRINGVYAQSFHGQKSQGARTEMLSKFKNGRIGVLVTTDLLGRGIDIEALPFVINYELPRSPKDYIHRIGRTGRAEEKGEAISLVSPEDEHHFRVIQKKMGKWVDRVDIGGVDLKGF